MEIKDWMREHYPGLVEKYNRMPTYEPTPYGHIKKQSFQSWVETKHRKLYRKYLMDTNERSIA